MQLEVAAQTIGLKTDDLTRIASVQLADLLMDPILNIYIVAKHLSDLKEIDFKDKELTWEDCIVLGNRYNIGPNASYETARDHIYMQKFNSAEGIEYLQSLLQDKNLQ